MALGAEHLRCGRGRTFDGLCQIRVTVPARTLGDLEIAARYPDRLGKPAGREAKGVPETVPRLRRIFRGQTAVWRVAVIAGGNCLMAGLRPTIELFIHDVTIGACCRIVAEVRITLRINESEGTDTHSDTDYYRKRNSNIRRRTHHASIISCDETDHHLCRWVMHP